MSLADCVCVVTGASSGIGAAIAAAMAAEGAAVVGFARRFEQAQLCEPPVPGQVTPVHLDVTDEAQVVARFAEVGSLDVLVNNAGGGHFGPMLELSAAELREMLEVHVVGSALCAREALRSMCARQRGHIVSIGSTACVELFPGAAGYTAAKRGQLGLTRVLAEECRPYGVRVTSVLAGAVDTPIWDSRDGFDRGQMMKPQELASVVVSVVKHPGVAVEELLVRPPAGNLSS